MNDPRILSEEILADCREHVTDLVSADIERLLDHIDALTEQLAEERMYRQGAEYDAGCHKADVENLEKSNDELRDNLDRGRANFEGQGTECLRFEGRCVELESLCSEVYCFLIARHIDAPRSLLDRLDNAASGYDIDYDEEAPNEGLV